MSEKAPIPGSTCPADGRALDPVSWSSREDVSDAVDRARSAQKAWAAKPFEERAKAAIALGRLIVERRQEAMVLLADEMGRSHVGSLMAEVTLALDYAKGAVAVARETLKPQRVRLSAINFPGKRVTIEQVPRGVVAIIEPWNYPLLQFYKPLFPALLSGNAVVLKPSEHVPRTGAWLVALCNEVFPKGLVGLVQGDGKVGAALVDSEIDAVVFCGSAAVGRKVAVQCAERLIPCSTELGGKDAAIVLADCDLDRTVSGILQWTMFNAGQDCSSIERIFVEESIAQEFVLRLGRAAAALTVAPDGEYADIGPIQNVAQLELIERQVADALTRGAVKVTGGERTGSGLGYRPTVMDSCTDEMALLREETFGPVAAIVRVEDVEEAIARANHSAYGLTASVWTRDLARGEAIARRLNVGIAQVNNHSFVGTIPQIPWTGTKGSGTGVAASQYAYPTFVRPQTILVDKNTNADVFWFPANGDLYAVGEAASQLALGSITKVFSLLTLLGKRARASQKLSKEGKRE